MEFLSNLDPVVQAVFSQISDGILLADQSGHLLFANESARHLLDLPNPIERVNLRSLGGINLTLRITQALIEAGHGDAVSKAQTGFVDFEQAFEFGSQSRHLFIRTGLVKRAHHANTRLLLLRDVTDLRRLQAKIEASESSGIITQDTRMRELLAKVQQVAPTEAFVLIQGESGTGKNLIAKMIHHQSRRATGPFVELNCAAIPEALIESELFGHVKGAFTGAVETRQGRFAAAAGGTIFLDEVGELPLHLQAKLLKVAQELSFEPVGSSKTQTVDVRIIAASNRNLRDAVNAHLFRGDLYYRLSVITLYVPSLRERKGDIPLLIQHFNDKLALRGYPDSIRFSDAALRLMLEYPWPGNVRELENAVEHATICAKEGQVEADGLPQDIRAYEGGGIAPRFLPSSPRHSLHSDEQLRGQILFALKKCHGKKSEVAKMLGMERTTLWRKMRKLGLN
jgi:transcriptional regulator with PAS, ATPase and Fis domain